MARAESRWIDLLLQVRFDPERASECNLAQMAYQAYGDSTGHKNFRGEPMPEWHALPPAIQTAWCAASCRLAEELGSALSLAVDGALRSLDQPSRT